MEKNFVVFVVVSAAVLFSWNIFFPPPEAPKAKTETSAAQRSEKKLDSEAAISAAASAVKVGAAIPAAASSQETKISVSNNEVQAQFSTIGARLISWKLINYEQIKGGNDPVELIPADSLAAGELEGYGVLHLPEVDFSTRAWELLTPVPVKEGDAQKVAFATPFKGPNFELRFVKEFFFYPDRFDAEVKVTITNPGTQALKVSGLTLTWGPGIGIKLLSADLEYGDQFLSGALVQTKDEKVFEKPDDVNETLSYGQPKWTALRNQYFVAALIPSEGWDGAEIRRIHRMPPNASGMEEMMAIALRSGSLVVEPGKPLVLSARLLASHQSYSFLKSFNNNLQGVVQFTPWRPFRVLDPLAIAMLYVLTWFYALVHNWGIALILLTLAVKGAMFYPTMKGMVSMRRMSAKMAKMQPRLETIKKMYKDDQTRLNQEMMKLYKEEGVNPLGGCLPLLVQMPIFFALYGTLLGSFELRGADFFWIWTDLSGPEKWPVLALLMGSSMFIQQKMTPQPSAQMNPDQAKMQKMMMNIMPVMLTVFAIFGGWPSGLLLYWAASNVFSIIQQFIVNRKYPVEGPVAPTVIPGT